MSRTNLLIGLSLAAHAGGVIALEWVRVAEKRAATALEIAEVVKTAPKPVEPARVEPTPPPPRRERAQPVARRAEAPPPPAPVSEAPPKAVGMDALPSFGLSLSGGASGTGLAVAAPRPSAPAPAPVKKLAPSSAAPVAPECSEPATKPKPISVPQPSYTVEARAAGVEGKVRVRLTVDETGQVVNVEVIEGLGHGLDDAASAAARAASFEPATQCGKAVRATFTISMRFAAS